MTSDLRSPTLCDMAIGKEFKEFILRGNVVDLAVGVVVGTAFNAVVQSLVKDLITPLVGLLGGFNFAGMSATLNKSVFLFGTFLNTIVSFIIIAAVVFFLVVKPLNAMANRKAARTPVVTEEPTTKTCPFCISDIPIQATRCPNCTSVLSDN